MRSGIQTTYILLERGFEDRQLREELHKVIAKAKLEISTKEFVVEYPILHNFMYNLRIELDKQEEV